MSRHIGRKLDAPIIEIHESQAVPAARFLQVMRSFDNADACILQSGRCPPHRVIVRHRICNVMEPSPAAVVKAQNETFRRRAAKKNRVYPFLDFIQAPDIAVEASVLFKTGREKPDVPDLPDFQRHIIAVPYGRFNLQLG